MKKMICFLCFVGLLFTIPVNASADYTLEDNQRVYIPKAYVFKHSIEGFSGIADIFIDDDDNLYVCDDVSNSIIKLNSKNEEVLRITEGLSKPRSIFVDDTGAIFVADTGNNRIAHFNKEGRFVEEFSQIKSQLLGDDFIFTPEKIAVTKTGYILAIKNQNIMQIDAYSNFRGYIGQPEVGFSFADMLLRKFASKDQKRFIRKRVAPPYTNLYIGMDGSVYATSRDYAYGEIKKLNSVGKNTFRQNPSSFEQALSFVSDFISVKLPPQYLGERKNDLGLPTFPVFVDIAVDEQGIITVLDSNLCRIYQYDQDGNALCCFSAKGQQKGLFDMPVALDINSKGDIYVGDKNLRNIQVFSKTAYIQSVHDAIFAYENGDYKSSLENWKKVLGKNENYRLAHKGLGLSLYKLGDYKAALDQFVLANDRESYSKAFDKYRYGIFKDYFLLVTSLIALFLAAFILYITFLRKISKRALELYIYPKENPGIMRNLFLLSLSTIFKPVDTFEAVKINRGKNRLYVGALIILAGIAVRILYILTVHFPVQDVDLREAMFSLEVLKIALPAVTWSVSAYAISSIMDGESKFSEVFTCTAYSLIPYIIFTPIIGFVSNFLTLSEWQFYSIAVVALMVWQAVLMFTAVMILNRYSISKTVVVCVLSFLTMLLIWAVILLCMSLIGQLFRFGSDVTNEIRLLG